MKKQTHGIDLISADFYMFIIAQSELWHEFEEPFYPFVPLRKYVGGKRKISFISVGIQNPIAAAKTKLKWNYVLLGCGFDETCVVQC